MFENEGPENSDVPEHIHMIAGQEGTEQIEGHGHDEEVIGVLTVVADVKRKKYEKGCHRKGINRCTKLTCWLYFLF